jgi:hypothetical protein
VSVTSIRSPRPVSIIPSISDLAARFPIEGRHRADEVGFHPFSRLPLALPSGINGENLRLGLEPVVADEADLPVELDFEVRKRNFPGFPATAPLLSHQFFESRLIDLDSLGSKNVLRQV